MSERSVENIMVGAVLTVLERLILRLVYGLLKNILINAIK